ncbi:hypothetical protein, partial [Flavobacterium sp. ENC]|uniref:hypothetical protein n=1 Tax=Flavobacterium sp. ENC TaxID=2897330 RepID=UPI001E354DF0
FDGDFLFSKYCSYAGALPIAIGTIGGRRLSFKNPVSNETGFFVYIDSWIFNRKARKRVY